MEKEEKLESLIVVPANRNAIWRYINKDEVEEIAAQAGIQYRQALNIIHGKGLKPNYRFMKLLTQKMEANKALIDRYNKLVTQ